MPLAGTALPLRCPSVNPFKHYVNQLEIRLEAQSLCSQPPGLTPRLLAAETDPCSDFRLALFASASLLRGLSGLVSTSASRPLDHLLLLSADVSPIENLSPEATIPAPQLQDLPNRFSS